MSKYTIGFYTSHKKDDKDHIWVIYNDSQLPARNLKPMNISPEDMFCWRKATEKETRQIENSYRFEFYPYGSIEKLIPDERKMGVPEETIQKMIEMYKKHHNHKEFKIDVEPIAPQREEQGVLFV